MLAKSRGPFDPQKSIGFLTVSQGPFVEKMTHLIADDEFDAAIIENLPDAGFRTGYRKKIGVGLKHNHTRSGLCPLTQNLAAIAQSPSKVQYNISLFELKIRIELVRFLQRIVRTVISDAIDLDCGLSRFRKHTLEARHGHAGCRVCN